MKLTREDVLRIQEDLEGSLWALAQNVNCTDADDKASEREVAEMNAVCALALTALDVQHERADPGHEPTKPETAGTWEERCAALYQVIGCLAYFAGHFDTQDVCDALDVATGRGDVYKLLPWPKDTDRFKRSDTQGEG